MHPFLKFVVPAFAFGIAMSGAALAQSTMTDRLITVTGEGSVTVVPDLAFVNLGVSHDAETADEALTAMSLGMTAVLARLEAAGIAPTDIQTGQLSLSQRYDDSSYDGRAKIVGFTATTTVNVRVRDMAKLGGILDAVVEDGANQFGGITFDIADRTAAMEASRRDAVADGRARAELYADAAGVTLGDLVTLNEQGGYMAPAPMMEARMAADAGSVPIAAGELSLQTSVTMVYAIAPSRHNNVMRENARTMRSGRFLFRLRSGFGQSLIQIGDQIGHILDSDGQTHDIVARACRSPLFGGQLAMRCRCRMDDKAAGIAEVRDMAEDLEPVHELDAGLIAALDRKGEQAARALGANPRDPVMPR
jgi:uncharacterized protein